MDLQNRKSNYDKFPHIEIKNFENEVWRDYKNIVIELNKKIESFEKEKNIIILDEYHGVDKLEIRKNLIDKLNVDEIILAEDAKYSEEKIFKMLEKNISEDRVFGVLSTHTLKDFFDKTKLEFLQEKVKQSSSKTILIYGIGASLIAEGDIVIYADMARWEIQQRFRKGEVGNWGVENFSEDILKRYKRSYFIEWRVFDRHKKSIFDKVDYLLDTNKKNDPKLITGNAFRKGLKESVSRPFRVVPFFDPGIWGGQWMKEVCDLDKSKENYAWCFDCVPEENSLNLKYGDTIVEIPSMDVVLKHPRELLGEKVHARFGAEFPIRFDFLDTMDGQHLSLQVHPLTEYIQEKFGMHYTQDESYYMLDIGEDACVYLGTKENIDPSEMIKDLEKAQKGSTFLDEKYINNFPAKKHDHFLIPAGTIHCSGKNSMVLEISSTPYIFTFKLWDWGRLGLDGIPRPIHLSHGKNVIQFDRTTKWVEENLINRIELIDSGDGWREERTGLHEREFIETRRHWFTKRVSHNTDGNLNVLNLVEGEEAIIESPTNNFEPYIVHYAETFIIPASVGGYTIRPYGKSEGKEIATMKAYVRF